MADFSAGDRVEILYHVNSAYTGRRGTVMFVGTTMRQGMDPLANDINTADQDARIIVALEDKTLLDDIRETQIRKVR